VDEVSIASASLAEIVIYPVKSLGGTPVTSADVQPWGLKHDRRWVVLRPDGTVLTARRHRAMLRLTATPLDSGAIQLSSADGSGLRVEIPADAEQVPVVVSRLETVRLANWEAGEWLSAQLGQHLRLGWLDDPRRRTVSLAHGGRPGEPLSLADAGPLLLTTTSSLARLNRWVADEVAEAPDQSANEIGMQRFRPNLVVSGELEPFIEDRWKSIRIGDVGFRFAEHCDRCMMTTIDPATLVSGKQPLRALARHHQWNHKTWFGIRLIPGNTGRIRVDDCVSADC
jgi:uncharacterized protein YcbX